jgi:hypothetical protein
MTPPGSDFNAAQTAIANGFYDVRLEQAFHPESMSHAQVARLMLQSSVDNCCNVQPGALRGDRRQVSTVIVGIQCQTMGGRDSEFTDEPTDRR